MDTFVKSWGEELEEKIEETQRRLHRIFELTMPACIHPWELTVRKDPYPGMRETTSYGAIIDFPIEVIVKGTLLKEEMGAKFCISLGASPKQFQHGVSSMQVAIFHMVQEKQNQHHYWPFDGK